MKILIDNVYAHLEFEENQDFVKYFEKEINEYINPLDPNRYRNRAFRNHHWDGRVALYDKEHKRLRVGLLYKLQKMIQKIYVEIPSLKIEYVDLREPAIQPKLDERIDIDRPQGDTITLYEDEDNDRSYQYEAIRRTFEEQRFVANISVNGGKTNVAIGVALEALKELDDDECIFFVCESKQIFYQVHDNFEAALHQEVGLWGDGKKDIKQVTCVMIGTVNSALKDPASTVKLTNQKDKVIKHFAEDYVPRFVEVPNLKKSIKAFIRTNKPKYSYDETIFETLSTMVSDPRMNDDKIRKALNYYPDKYQKLLRSKASKSYDKYQEALDIVNRVKVIITDECLVAGTQVLLDDNTTKSIEKLEVGDILWGNNRVTNLIKKDEQPIMRIEHSLGYLEGTVTHPVAVWENDNITYKPLMKVRKGDELMVPKVNAPVVQPDKNDNYYLARLYGMIVADGSFLRQKNKNGYVRTNTIRVNVSRDFEWYREVMRKGINAFNNLFDKKVVYVDKLDSRENLILRVNDKEFADYMESLGLICGKKSGKIATPPSYLGRDDLMIPFIEGIMNCEGGVNAYNGTSHRLTSDMCSEKLQEEILAWLLQHGIYATTLVRKRVGNHSSVYRISLSGTNLNKFYDIFDMMERKRLRSAGASNSNKLLQEIDGYYLSPVKERVSTDKELPTYDITTENHTFIANGVLNHNCHHAVAGSYQKVFSYLTNARVWLGLTGTIPSKKDEVKRSLFEGIFGNNIKYVSNKYLIDSGISAKPLIKMLPINLPEATKLDMEAEQSIPRGTPKNQKDLLLYQAVYRLGITENDYRNELIAKLTHKLRSSDTGATLIVVNSIEHGDYIKEILEEEYGEEVYYLQGADSTSAREEVINKVRSGEVKILIGTTILDEGMDLPNLKYLIYASAGKSSRQVIQRIGRVLRISPEKKSTVVFDFIDRTHRLLFNQAKTRMKVYKDEQFDISQ